MASQNEASIWTLSAPIAARNIPRSRYNSAHHQRALLKILVSATAARSDGGTLYSRERCSTFFGPKFFSAVARTFYEVCCHFKCRDKQDLQKKVELPCARLRATRVQHESKTSVKARPIAAAKKRVGAKIPRHRPKHSTSLLHLLDSPIFTMFVALIESVKRGRYWAIVRRSSRRSAVWTEVILEEWSAGNVMLLSASFVLSAWVLSVISQR
jgi:hypothetical protein